LESRTRKVLRGGVYELERGRVEDVTGVRNQEAPYSGGIPIEEREYLPGKEKSRGILD